MAALALRLALVVGVMCAAAVGLVRARQHDTPLRRLLVSSEACSAPCWQGIEPTVTTAEAAMHALEGHPWLREVEPWGQRTILLHWSGAQPAPINADLPGVLTLTNGVVTRISLPTTEAFGYFWLLHDQPKRGGFICLGRAWRSAAVHFATFPGSGFTLSLSQGLPSRCRPNVAYERCRLPFDLLWTLPSDLILGPVQVQLHDYSVVRSATPPVCLD